MSDWFAKIISQPILSAFRGCRALMFAMFLILAVPSWGWTQVFDSVIASALSNCAAAGITTVGGSALDAICNPVTAPTPTLSVGPSGGSVTAQTRQGPPGSRTISSDPTAEELIPIWKDVNLWISAGYERFIRDPSTFEPGYLANKWRSTVGIDKLFYDLIIAGVAFNYGQDNANFSGGGDYDIDGYGPRVYASFLPAENVFIDTYFEYTHKDFSINRRASYTQRSALFPFNVLTNVDGLTAANTDIREHAFGMNVGYDVIPEKFKNITVGPRAGFHFLKTAIDEFTESGSTGLELAYDDQQQTSVTTTLGGFISMALSTSVGVFIPQMTAEWIHEYERNQRRIGFRFVGDTNGTKFFFQNERPDRNFGNVSVGVVAILPKGFVPFFNYRAQVGFRDQSSHATDFGLRKEF